jgi:PAS domain S-box-containing protein
VRSASAGRRRVRLRWVFLATFGAGALAVGGFTWYHIAAERREAVDHWRARVSTQADDRARVITDWLRTRQGDAEVLAASASIRAALIGGEAGGLVRELDRVAAAYGYSGIAVLSPDGRVLARSSGAGSAPEALGAATRAALRGGGFQVDIAGADGGARAYLALAAPVLAGPAGAAGGQRLLGALAFRMPLETGLWPLLAGAAVATETEETLLLRVGGGPPAYLSPLRREPAGWKAVERSLERLGAMLHASAPGAVVFGALDDYREVPVFAAARRLPGTPWALVLKIDQSEALAGFYQAGRLGGLASAFLLLALGGFLAALWRQYQRTDLLREQIEQERAFAALRSHAETIVASVPAGLFVLSSDLRVVSANRSALDLLRQGQAEVLGQPLDTVLRADGLAQRAREVMRLGVAQHDMVFHVQLVARRETRPVRATITGTRMALQDDARLLLIVQDLTEEQRLQAARRASEERLRDLVQGLDAVVWEAEVDTLRFTFVSQRAEVLLGHPVDRWLNDRDWWTARIHAEDRAAVTAALRAALDGGEDADVEYRAVAADGRRLWLRDRIRVVRDVQGRPVQLRGLTDDVTKRRQAEQALRESEERMRAIAEATPVPLAITTVREGAFIYVNEHALHLLRLGRREDLERMRAADLWADPAVYARFQEALRTQRRVADFEWQGRRPDGSTFWSVLSTEPMTYDGAPAHVNGFVDITERKALEVRLEELVAQRTAELSRANAELEEAARTAREAQGAAEVASRAKSQFLANMSHELRTPLNAILGYTELILDDTYGEVPEKIREVLDRVEKSGRHLLGLINDVLDLSKIEAGQLSLAVAPYSMADVVHSVFLAVESLAAEKRLDLRVALPPDLPPARGDERRITQVLLNLVGNAIKFTDAGYVAVEVTAAEGWFTVAVRDTGPGIAPEAQQKIFEEFQQEDSSNTRKKGGTGLGLSIARRIIELHGGRLRVESAPQAGSTFSFTIPVAIERRRQQLPVAVERRRPGAA